MTAPVLCKNTSSNESSQIMETPVILEQYQRSITYKEICKLSLSSERTLSAEGERNSTQSNIFDTKKELLIRRIKKNESLTNKKKHLRSHMKRKEQE